MLQVQVDEEAIKQLYIERIEQHLKELDKDLLYWDTKELKRRTCLSWNTIQNTFFWEEDFPKVKLGGKWLFPAAEAEAFLKKWLKEKWGNKNC